MDDYVFLDNAIVYPSYSYLCSLLADEECPYQINSYSGKPGENLAVSISVKPEQEAKFDLPTLELFSAGEGIAIYTGESATQIPLDDVDYDLSSRTSATLTIPHTLIFGKVTLAITSYRPEYEVTFTNESAESRLKFEPVNQPINDEHLSVKKGEAFMFNVTAINDTDLKNSVTYLAPKTYKIYLGESKVPIANSFYEVKRSDDKSAATVTIKENVINGKVRIYGEAAAQYFYQCAVISLGGIKSVPTRRVSLNEISHIIQLEVDGPYRYPKSENIYVDDGERVAPINWYKPEMIDYNSTTGIIVIGTAKEDDTFTFLLAGDEYPILEEANWDDIETMSINKYAPYFFRMGETKSIDVGGVSHQIRIIGFDHDDLADASGRKAGITFEFAELFSIKDGERYLRCTIDWGIDNHSFPNQHINGFYNGDVYDRLSSELKKVIKSVSKETTLEKPREDPPHILTNYQTKLFPLSYEEMTKEPNKIMGLEGSTYKYYEEHDSNKYRMKYASHQAGEYAKYWLRSFPLGSTILAGSCRNDGSLDATPIIFPGFEEGVAPAFCV